MHAHNVQTNQKHCKDKFNHYKRQVTCNKQYLQKKTELMKTNNYMLSNKIRVSECATVSKVVNLSLSNKQLA